MMKPDPYLFPEAAAWFAERGIDPENVLVEGLIVEAFDGELATIRWQQQMRVPVEDALALVDSMRKRPVSVLNDEWCSTGQHETCRRTRHVDDYSCTCTCSCHKPTTSEPGTKKLSAENLQKENHPSPTRPEFPPHPGDVEAQNAVATLVTKHWPQDLRSPLFSTRIGIARDVVAWLQEHRPHQGGA